MTTSDTITKPFAELSDAEIDSLDVHLAQSVWKDWGRKGDALRVMVVNRKLEGKSGYFGTFRNVKIVDVTLRDGLVVGVNVDGQPKTRKP